MRSWIFPEETPALDGSPNLRCSCGGPLSWARWGVPALKALQASATIRKTPIIDKDSLDRRGPNDRLEWRVELRWWGTLRPSHWGDGMTTPRMRRRLGLRVAFALTLFGSGATAVLAQTAPAPGPASGAPRATAPVSPASPPAVGTAREAQLEQRIRELEATVNRLSDQVQRLVPPTPAPATDDDADNELAPPAMGPAAPGAAPIGTATPDVGD